MTSGDLESQAENDPGAFRPLEIAFGVVREHAAAGPPLCAHGNNVHHCLRCVAEERAARLRAGTGHLSDADRDPVGRRSRALRTMADTLRKLADQIETIGGEA